MVIWRSSLLGQGFDGTEPVPPLTSRLVTDDDLKAFYEVMNLYEVPKAGVVSNSNVGLKPKGRNLWGIDTLQYGRGKRAREVVVAPGSQCILAAVVTPVLKSIPAAVVSPGLQSIPASVVTPGSQSIPSGPSASIQSRGRGRKVQSGKLLVDPTHQSVPGIASDSKSTPPVSSITSAAECLPPGPSASVQIKGQSRKTQTEAGTPRRRGKTLAGTFPGQILSTDMRDVATVTEELPAENSSAKANFDEQDADGKSIHQVAVKIASNSEPTASYPSISPAFESIPPESLQVKRQGRKAPNRAEAPRRRGKKQGPVSPSVDTLVGQDLKANP
ncbi:hypothetical protein P3X46_006019 [Hevea brasiliensis]|uniref:Uncharacterized protein n=1 Tax=Hevea brasiliensis TaxID=3981 RepID=A0ABQ9MRG5_HEVBR|nr:hypothetical protein P3X46_006019 [Hevea brasiliensis]